MRRASHGSLFFHDLDVGAADEAEHEEEGDNPEGASDVEIVSHGPDADTPGRSHGAHADLVVLGVEDGAGGDEDTELEEADEAREVGGADSESVSPGADEHEEGVEGDETVDETHEAGDQGHLRASSLAIEVAIVDHVDVVSHEVTIDLRVVPSERISEGQDRGSLSPAFHRLVACASGIVPEVRSCTSDTGVVRVDLGLGLLVQG